MKKIFVVLPILIVAVTVAFGQQGEDSVKATTPTEREYVRVDQQAQFPGGMMELYDYMRKNVRVPRGAGEGGKVYIEFIINKDGSILDDSIKSFPMEKLIKARINIKDVTEEKPFVEEGIRLVKNMPDWTPAQHNKMPVKSKFVLPITIRRK
jgi:periplasmic protein TonB